MSDMAKISVRIDDTLLGQLRALAARQNRDLSDVFRDAVRAYVQPTRLAPEAPPTDPVLQAISNGIRREAASRGLSPGMIVQLWFNMMNPGLPAPKAQPDLMADGLKLNLKISDEPEEPRS
jgi:Ribbon-helix-helix protein, copG family